MKLRLSVFVIAAFGVIQWASAVNESAPSSDEVDGFEFSCLVWEPLALSELYYRKGAEFLPLKLTPGCRSPKYVIKGTSSLELHFQREGPEGQSEYRLVGLAPRIDHSDRVLFIIEEIEDSHGLPLQLIAFDDSLEAFPAGSFRFVNETPDSLRIVFGGESSELAVASSIVVPSAVGKSGGFLPVAIQDKLGSALLETRLFCQANGRQIAFIRPPKNAGGRLRVTYLSELLAGSEM